MSREEKKAASQKREDLDNQSLIDSYDYISGAASAGDCTGLIPSLPSSEAEIEFYDEMYPYLPRATANTK